MTAESGQVCYRSPTANASPRAESQVLGENGVLGRGHLPYQLNGFQSGQIVDHVVWTIFVGCGACLYLPVFQSELRV